MWAVSYSNRGNRWGNMSIYFPAGTMPRCCTMDTQELLTTSKYKMEICGKTHDIVSYTDYSETCLERQLP